MQVPIEIVRANAPAASALLATMANPARLQILCLISDGERTVSELCDAVGLSQSALSQHLAILRKAGIVQARREAQFVRYSLASREATALLETLCSLFAGADQHGASD